MRERLLCLLTPLMAMVLLSSAGIAQEKRSAEELSRLEEEAWKAAAAGQFQRAIDVWEDILHEITGEGRVALHKNLAAAYGKLDDLPTSWYHLTSYLEKTSREDAKAARQLEKLEKKLMATHRRVFVSCDPEGATLHFALEATGTSYACPITWWFKPGKQFVHVASKGYREQSAQYDVRKRGEKGVWTVKLEELPRSGILVVKGQGRAIQVFLNGNLEGTVPFKRKLQAGSYELMVGKPGEMPWKKTVTVKAGQTLVEAPPNAQSVVGVGKLGGSGEDDSGSAGTAVISDTGAAGGPSMTGPMVLLAGGVGVVVAGAALNGVGYAREQDLYKRHEPVQWDGVSPRTSHNEEVEAAAASYEAAYADEVQPLKTWTYVMYGVGGAAAAAGAVWLIVNSTSDSEKSEGVEVLPLAEPGAVGAMLGLKF
jgi:hypothetical protein